MDGILNINKPAGMTSFAVVSRIRRICKTQKVGHAGTLDPDARGVLPVCVGKATKVIEFFMDHTKTYRVGLMLGAATDTQDASGNVLYEKPVQASDEEIEVAIKSFLGEIKQIPPMYSAIKINGKKLYELARKGIEVERKPRTVTFYRIDILDMVRRGDKAEVVLDVECSKGTYMRTLCHDIGEKLGCGGYMGSLTRMRSGPFSIENSYSLEELENAEDGMPDSALLPVDWALNDFPVVRLNDKDARRFRNGLDVPREDLTEGFVRVYHESGGFMAVGKIIIRDKRPELRIYKWIGCDSNGL